MKYKFLVFSLLLFSIPLSAQKLDKAKEGLKENITAPKTSSEKNIQNEKNFSFGDYMAYELLIRPLVWITTKVTYGIFVESFFEQNTKHSKMKLTPHPYANKMRGDYTIDTNGFVANRVDLSNVVLTDMNHTYGNNLNVKFRFLERTNIEYNQLYLLESDNDIRSQFFMHDLTVNYYRIRTKKICLNYGLGASYVHSQVNKAYFTYNTGVSYFLSVPLSLGLEYKKTPFYDNGITQTKINFNYHVRQYAMEAGYRFYQIGNVSYKMVALGAKVYL
ncbi:MAG: hypothetical protein ABF278_00985 [Wenyingzhuangia sp.]|jgi:hypothetical protein|uniref:hypothetical protein n=1 Tax=Wenyingzhuangia sp. TaxID=1964193 RepID=UPI00321C1CFC